MANRQNVRSSPCRAAAAAIAFATGLTLACTGAEPLPEASAEWTAPPTPEVSPDILWFLGTPGDSPQVLGPRRTGGYDIRFGADWEARPPEEIWRRPVGPGRGAFAAVGRVAITQEQRGPDEALVAYNVDTGQIAWSHTYAARREDPDGVGPAATPTIWGDTVWAVGGTGVLSAVGLLRGQSRWSRDVVLEQGGAVPRGGVSASPLVVGDLVIVAGAPGGPALVAYERLTGERRWRSARSRSGLGVPVRATLDGRDQIIATGDAGLAGYDAATGQALWEAPWPGTPAAATQPLALADLLMVSADPTGTRLFGVRQRRQRFVATVLWDSDRLRAGSAQFVPSDGFVYGLDRGVLTCIDPRDGTARWRGANYGAGRLIVSAGVLVVQAEDGTLALVDASPDGFVERGRIAVLEPPARNLPTLVGDTLLLRNDREAVALRLQPTDG